MTSLFGTRGQGVGGVKIEYFYEGMSICVYPGMDRSGQSYNPFVTQGT